MAEQLVVYIPSRENFAGALAQVQRLRAQESLLESAPWRGLRLVVSVNGSRYDVESLRDAGAEVIVRPLDLGGDVNIALGFIEADAADYLWVLSDNDPVRPSALSCVAEAFLNPANADMVVGVSDARLNGATILRSPVTSEGANFHVGLISAVVYRWSAFIESTPAVFQTLWTGWGQIALQEQAVRNQDEVVVMCVPIDDLVSLTRGDQSDQSVSRARQAYTHSFYGGALLSYLGVELAGSDGRREISRWWRRNWMFASAYRPKESWPTRNFRAPLVEALVRTGRPLDRLLWLLSAFPYWRVGVLLKRRGVRLRQWT